MAHLGGVFTSNGKFFAKIETREGGMRFYMEGPRREDKQQAAQDLTDIRAAASGKATRLDELHAMKLATKPATAPPNDLRYQHEHKKPRQETPTLKILSTFCL